MNVDRLERQDIPQSLQRNPIVAVLRAKTAAQYKPVIEALVSGGIRSIELTLSTSGVFDLMPALLEEFQGVDIGVGTITTSEQAEQALDQGARFLVTPAMRLEIVRQAVERGIPIYPGGFTPSEILSGWEAGATAVKLFPASTVGPNYLHQLRGPFPGIQVMPSGGIGLDDVSHWLAAGAVAVSLGGPLLQDAFTGGDLQALAARSATVIATAKETVERKEKL